MSARAQVLAAVRLGISSRTAVANVPAEPGARPAAAAVLDIEQRVQLFTSHARTASATVARVSGRGAVPAAVTEFLQSTGQGLRIAVGGTAANFPWAGVRDLELVTPGIADGETLVTGCFAGVAEVGAIALVSGPEYASESAFLAATHVVIVETGQLLHSLEDLWTRLSEAYTTTQLPRMVNIILGPSRTADLGVPSRLGAHGPRRVHIVITDAGIPAPQAD